MSELAVIAKRIILKNASAQLVSTVVRLGATALISILVARYWGAELYGQYVTIIAFVMIFKFAADWGLQQWIVREVARDRQRTRQYVSASLLVMLLASSLVVMAIFAIDHFFNISQGKRLLLLLGCLWMVLGAFALFFSGVFYAYERMELDTCTVLAETAVTFGLVILILPNTAGNLPGLMAILVVARLANLLVSIFIYWRLVGGFERRANLALSGAIFVAAVPFGLQTLLSAQTNFHVIILSQFHSNQATGMYKAAQMIAMLPVLLAAPLSNVIYPRLSRFFGTSMATYRAMLEKGVHYMFAGGMPVSIGMFLLADRILVLIYGPAYQDSAIYMRILSLSLPVSVIGNLLAVSITSADRQGLRTMIMFLGSLLSVALGLWLIPPYAGVGASLTVTIVRVVNFLLFLALAIRIAGWPYRLRLALPVLLASFLLAGFIKIAAGLPLVILVPSGAALYSLALLASDGAIRADFHQLQLLELCRSTWRKAGAFTRR